MRRWAMVLAVAVVAGCNGGGDDDDGGGGPTGGAVLTVAGTNPLTATHFAAVTQGATCTIEDAELGAAYIALIASDQGGICGYLQRNQDKAGARSINVAVVRIDPASATTAVQPGTYTIVESPTGLEAEFAFLSVTDNDASCDSDDDVATAGTVTITSTTDGRVRGSVDATLQSGATVTGTFDAESCAVTFSGDLCQGEVGPQDPTCAP